MFYTSTLTLYERIVPFYLRLSAPALACAPFSDNAADSFA
jgi:hypothetical protein